MCYHVAKIWVAAIVTNAAILPSLHLKALFLAFKSHRLKTKVATDLNHNPDTFEANNSPQSTLPSL